MECFLVNELDVLFASASAAYSVRDSISSFGTRTPVRCTLRLGLAMHIRASTTCIHRLSWPSCVEGPLEELTDLLALSTQQWSAQPTAIASPAILAFACCSTRSRKENAISK
eukprot:3717699-Pleurochrysis_carterae.AAC.1